MSKKILITGASGAFGSLAAKALITNGHSVVGTMRSVGAKNETIARSLQDLGVHLVEMDVTDENSVNQGTEKAIELLGGLDVVINNAGIGAMGIQEFATADDMKTIFDVNVFGVQRLMRAVLPHLRSQGQGTIMHISSCIGRLAMPFYGTYSASKWALEALAESYRAELSAFGIESCIVEPGGMPTSFLDAMLRPSDKSREASYGEMSQAPEASFAGFHQALLANPLQRPEKVAEAISDLLDLPFGEKPFRTTVDYMGMGEPVTEYNNMLHGITRGLYGNFGMEGMLGLNKD
ncbi:MAG: SDR family oxidoreductase [Roseivirga sp.]|nr:SDR family oxidoreductase [Roseivirga sp.]